MKEIVKRLTLGCTIGIILGGLAISVASAQKKPAPRKKVVAVSNEAVAAPEPRPEIQPQAMPVKTYQAKICVATPKTNLAPAETAAESLRNSVVKYLSGPAAEIIVLDAMVAVQQQAEASEKGCSYYLSVSLMQKKKGGGEGLGGFLKNSAAAAPLLGDLGNNKTAQTVSGVATRSAAKMTTAGDLAIAIKAKDEVTLEYALVDVATRVSTSSGKIKAKAGKDGEDILSPMLEQSANAVLSAALKK